MSGHEFVSSYDDASGIDTSTEQTRIGEHTIEEMRGLAARYPDRRSALLPMLHLVQSVDGYLSNAGIKICAEVLGLTTAQVNGVATFYSMYKRRPPGRHHIGVCTTSVCAVLGGDILLEHMEQRLGIHEGETSPDGQFSLERIECNAACDFAPIMMVNWEFMDNMTPEKADELIDRLAAGKPVQSTRGATVVDWKQAERVLAGFDDGRADEGPSAGDASLRGLEIARRNDWHAPDDPGSGSLGEEQK
ncbi:NADH-quinone oxidoreductase subunit NuoE [Propionibacterium cyclohexanicum]|nr:NADH-quinone oxidoreductase subunit NuoE [Propionibacterium cyclohexanicum]